MPTPETESQFIRVRRDVKARLNVAVSIAGNGSDQADVASELLTEAMDARKTPHPIPAVVKAERHKLVQQLVGHALDRKRSPASR